MIFKTAESAPPLFLRALVKASQQRPRAILGHATSWPICLIFAHTKPAYQHKVRNKGNTDKLLHSRQIAVAKFYLHQHEI